MREETFATWWPALCERFNREPSTLLAAMYFDSLRERLSDEEFVAAASSIFESHRYWPSPRDFIQEAKGSAQADALEQWSRCQRQMRGASGVAAELDAAGQRAVELLGGMHRLRQTVLEQVQWVRKDFLALYQQVREVEERQGVPALQPATEEEYQLLSSVVPKLLEPGR
jgi:hypothetical protein